jgi:glutathione peroxidase-family protein
MKEVKKKRVRKNNSGVFIKHPDSKRIDFPTNNPHAIHEHLASAAYHNNPESIHGYKIDQALSDKETKVFVNQKGKVIVSFRGTAATQDLVSDLGIVTGDRGARFIKSLDVTKKAIAKYGQENVEVTGHSLGGTIARHVSEKLGLKGKAFNPGASPFEAVTGHVERGHHIKTIINIGDPISNSLIGGANVETRLPSQPSPHSIESPFNKNGSVKEQFVPTTKPQEISQAQIDEEISQNPRVRPGTQENEAFRNYLQEQYNTQYQNSEIKPDFEKYVQARTMETIENHITGEMEFRRQLQEQVRSVNTGKPISPEFQSKFATKFGMVSDAALNTFGGLFIVASIVGPPLWDFYSEADRIEKEAEKEKTFEARQQIGLAKEENWIKYFNGYSKIYLSTESVLNNVLEKHTPWIGKPYYTLNNAGYQQLLLDEGHYILLPNHDKEKTSIFGPEAYIEPIPPGLQLLAKPVEADFGRGLLGTPAGDPNITYKLCYRAQDPGIIRYVMIPTLTEDLQTKENWFRFSYTLKNSQNIFKEQASLNNFDGWLNDGFNVNKPIGQINIGDWWALNKDKYLLYVASQIPPTDSPVNPVPEPITPTSELSQSEFYDFLEMYNTDPQSVTDYIARWSNAKDLLQWYHEWLINKGFPEETTDIAITNALNGQTQTPSIVEVSGELVLPSSGRFQSLFERQNRIFEKQFR